MAVSARKPGRPRRVERPEPAVKEEQCLYCSLYFQNVSAHQRLVHKGEIPVEADTPIPSRLGPGEIFHPIGVPGQPPPPPRKTPWTKRWIEFGYECGDTGCRHREIYDGPITDPKELPSHLDHVCPKCRTVIARMFGMVEYEPPRSERVIWQGVEYALRGGEVNIVPSIIRDTLRQAFQEERDRLRIRQDSDRAAQLDSVRVLPMTGLLPPLEQEK